MNDSSWFILYYTMYVSRKCWSAGFTCRVQRLTLRTKTKVFDYVPSWLQNCLLPSEFLACGLGRNRPDDDSETTYHFKSGSTTHHAVTVKSVYQQHWPPFSLPWCPGFFISPNYAKRPKDNFSTTTLTDTQQDPCWLGLVQKGCYC